MGYAAAPKSIESFQSLARLGIVKALPVTLRSQRTRIDDRRQGCKDKHRGMPEWASDAARNRSQHAELDSDGEVSGVWSYACWPSPGSALRHFRQFRGTVTSEIMASHVCSARLCSKICTERFPSLSHSLNNSAMGSGALVLPG